MDYQDEYNQMMKEGVKSQKKFQYTVIAVVAFVLGFGVAWFSFKNQNVSPIVSDDKDKTEQENRIEAVVDLSNEITLDENGLPENLSLEDGQNGGGVSLSVLDQAPADSVFVDEVSSPRPVWVVVVENNNGSHGNILGAGLFDPEDKAGVVKLLRGTAPGGLYYAVLYTEDSNLTEGRSFDLETDSPLLDADGNTIEVMFKTSSSPE